MERGDFQPVLKVVVVEDDPTFLSFWRRLMQDLGVSDYEIFSDAIEASFFLEEIPCGLLISDIIMPGINGYALAGIARRRSPACNIILTTAYNADLSRFNLYESRFHLLHKPYTNLHALKRFVRHMIDDRLDIRDIEEDSSSENEDYPEVTEWKL